MQENKKSIKLQKVGTIALLCLLVVAFVGSIFCAIILPFSDGVANAYNGAGRYMDIVPVMMNQRALNISFNDEVINMSGVYGLFLNTSFNINDFNFLPFVADSDSPYRQTIFSMSLDSVTVNESIVLYVLDLSSQVNTYLSVFGGTPLSFTDNVYALAFSNCTDSAQYINACQVALIKANAHDKDLLLNFSYTDSEGTVINFDYIFGLLGFYPSFDMVSLSYLANCEFANTGAFTINTIDKEYIKALSNFVSLTGKEFSSGVEEVLSPEYFATRFVTPTDSPSNTVFFNLDTMPKSPNIADFETYSSGSTSWYYYDYFQEYGTDGSMISANDVKTVGWHVSVHKEVSPPNTTILGYYVSLRIGRMDIYSYYVSGSNYDTGVVSDQKWLVSSNYTFGDMKLYKYDFSGSTSYYTLLPHEEGKVRPVDLQFGANGWNSWLALFDLSNFVSLSNDVYINLGYQNAKLYYDELIKTKSQESYLQGKNKGYELGLQDGKLQGGNYTFTSLLGAVFDAPIEAFRGLFNFEILGTNMQGFVLALLTLSVIIIVIRIALGGK